MISSIRISIGFFLFRTLAEVIELCHLAGKTIGQFLDLLILLVFLVLLSEELFLFGL